jgi:predicted GIY-YIG superfamily endonuclease
MQDATGGFRVQWTLLPSSLRRTTFTAQETRARVADHHSVYVVYLRNPKGDGRAAYYVGMTGLTPEERFKNHKSGVKAARVVRKYGVRLVPKLYAHLNPMPYAKAARMEEFLADSLRKRGYEVYGGH